MRPSRDLRRLQGACLKRLDRLRSVAVIATAAGAPPVERETGVTTVVLELYNCWYSLSRSLYLSSAFRAREPGGGRVQLLAVPCARTVDEALGHAIRRNKPAVFARRKPPWTWADEPSWASSKVLLDSLDEIGASNLPTVSAALSIPVATIDNLAPFRHFFAHRGRDTVRRLRPLVSPYAISPTLRPTEALCAHAGGAGGLRPQPLLVDWVDDVVNVVSLLV
jgi:hypothetical protein